MHIEMPMVEKIKNRLFRNPDVIIGGTDPYLRRWHLTERRPERWKVYLHNILRDDDDRALHDHPSCSISIILRGGYIEHFPDCVKRRYPGMVIFRRAEQPHRLELHRDKNGKSIPAWTIFIFGPKVREWGFHCRDRWVHWRDFTAPGDSSRVGKGCGE